jgi:hypothetical protein
MKAKSFDIKRFESVFKPTNQGHIVLMNRQARVSEDIVTPRSKGVALEKPGKAVTKRVEKPGAVEKELHRDDVRLPIRFAPYHPPEPKLVTHGNLQVQAGVVRTH